MKRFKIYHDDDIIGGQIPDSWEEITVKQWAAMRPNSEPIELLSIFSNIDLSHLENTRADLNPIIRHIYEKLILDGMNKLDHRPRKPLSILGHEIKFPKDLNFERYGQKFMLKKLQQEKDDMREVVADALAIYAQPLIDGKFDGHKLEPIKKAIESLPIVLAFPWCLFFLKTLNASKRTSIVDWQPSQ
tara:strand:- start:921 stop:1484 length:564 start_codon:yes stop_codon:yes gene_type:complete